MKRIYKLLTSIFLIINVEAIAEQKTIKTDIGILNTKKKLKIFLILLLISGITIGIVEAKVKTTSTTVGWPPWDGTSPVQSTNTKNVAITGSGPNVYTESTTPDLFLNVCCLRDYYELDVNHEPSYFQLPIRIEVTNKSMKPQKNVKINVQIDIISNVFNRTRLTDSNGVANFGYSMSYDFYKELKKKYPGLEPYSILIWITATRNNDKFEYITTIYLDQD